MGEKGRGKAGRVPGWHWRASPRGFVCTNRRGNTAGWYLFTVAFGGGLCARYCCAVGGRGPTEIAMNRGAISLGDPFAGTISILFFVVKATLFVYGKRGGSAE